MSDQRERVVEVISSEIQANGFVRVNQLTGLLEKNEIDRSIYGGQGPKQWMKSNFPEFKVEGDNGTEVIVFASAQDNDDEAGASEKVTTVIEEEKLNCSALLESAAEGQEKAQYKIGVVSYCRDKNGFVNRGYDKKRKLDKDQSVIFIPDVIKTTPANTRFDTKKYVYLVGYAVSGIVKNRKKGTVNPAIDYSAPMRVLRTVPVKDCAYIKISPETVTVGRIRTVKQNAQKNVATLEEALPRMDALLQEKINETGYVLSSIFPQIAKQCGLAEFRRHADSVELFLKAYLPEYELKTNVILSGIRYPGVIIRQGDNLAELENVEQNHAENAKRSSPKVSLGKLDELFEAERYVEFLGSDILKNVPPQELPLQYLEKALTCAHRLIYPGSQETIRLNRFQQELITNPTSDVFIKKWKINGRYEKEFIEECGDTAIAHFDYPEHNKYVVKLLNAIGTNKSLNSSYTGIITRFVACENVLIPHFYVLQAFVQNSKSTIQRIVVEYCKLVKDLKNPTSEREMSDDLRMCAFHDVLRIIHTYLFDCSQLSQTIRTNIASVFVEYDKMSTLKEVISLWDPEHTFEEWHLVDLYFNLEQWDEQKFIQFIRNGVSRQLLQRCLALLWRESCRDNVLSESYLRLLSWIILHEDFTSIDEIIGYSSGKQLTENAKQRMLVDSLEAVCSSSAENDQMYALASYIVFSIQAVLKEEETPDEILEKLEFWSRFSKDFYSRKTQCLEPITAETESDYGKLFPIFQLDIQNYLRLQANYAEWFVRTYAGAEIAEADMDTILAELCQKGAYAAFAEVYSSNLEFDAIRKKYASEYVGALIRLHRHTEAISFIWDLQSVVASDKNALLIRAVGENFRENGISTKAFSCIGDASRRNEIIKILMAEYDPAQSLIINSLIALYVHEKKYMNAAYLYSVFGSRFRRGFVRLYRQIHSVLGKQVNLQKCRSRHHVISIAFQTLYADDLVAFLSWASGIVIPNYKERTEKHLFSFNYDRILENVKSQDGWILFLDHLVKNGNEKNAWNICVCETVLQQTWNYEDSRYSESALDYFMSNTDVTAYPPNFLSYAFRIIEDSQSTGACRRLVELLKDEALYKRVITDNKWLKTQEANINSFKQYCQTAYSESGDPAYREMLSLLGDNFSISELKELTRGSTSKRALFCRMCTNYLNDCEIDETAELLFSDDWNGLSENERGVLNILRMIYTDDDVLLLDPEDFFGDECFVRRFKQDCAEILLAYPEKTGLRAFDKDCTDEAYKMLVYSYVFEALYDQNLYEALDKRFSDLKDVRMYRSYLRLLDCAYRVQSVRNKRFPFFYQKWRYLKLYLTRVLRYSAEADDSDIVRLMERNYHYDAVYTVSYLPFVERVQEFLKLEGVSEEFKTHFLFALMVSYPEDLYVAHAQTLCRMPAGHRAVCRNLIESLDYRYFNKHLFEFLWESICSGNYDRALTLAEATSDYVFDAIAALRDDHRPTTMAEFEKLAFLEKPSQVLYAVDDMDLATIVEYHKWLMPLLCSRQFDFLINERFRKLIIMKQEYLTCEKYKYVSDYLASKGKSRGMHSYLCALLACMKKDPQTARNIAAHVDLRSLVPYGWLKEANQIIGYANGTLQDFKPGKIISDGSQENVEQVIRLSFVEELLRSVFYADANDADSALKTEPDLSALDQEYAEAQDPWEKSRLGLEALFWRTQTYIPNTEAHIQAVNELALNVGLGLLGPDINLTGGNRLLVLAELYTNRSVYSSRRYSSQLESLYDQFSALINGGITLPSWVQYAELIEEFLKETNSLEDFPELRVRILSKCEQLLSPKVAYEQKYKEYSELLDEFSGLTSSYSLGIIRAIRAERERLENGIRLTVEIENQETTDGYVYFRINNVGRRTVSFSSEALTVVFHQQNQPAQEIRIEHITELQSGAMTGGRARLVISPSDEQVFIKLMVVYTTQNNRNELVCSTEAAIFVGPSCDPNVPAEALEVAGQSVSSAVIDDELLFGRDDKKELLAQKIPSGVTLIYGPSRIGKTSMMNWIRNKHAVDKGNVMTVLIGGEHSLGKDSDYKFNMNDRTRTESVPYGDPYKMSQYLLVDTLIYGLTQRDRLGKPESVQLPGGLIHDMRRVLQDEGIDIKSKYYELNDLLEASGIELWLLLDEFQQVVEHWDPPAWCEFVEICNLLSSPERNKPNHIKIVFCGSDDLLTHMIVKADSVWKNTFRSTVPVNALLEPYFEEMIKKDRAKTMTNLSFSPQAISTLFNYTGGIALYGKEICRAIFEDIRANAKKWASRNTIYTSDIAETTQTLLNRQSHDLSIQAQEGISTIYAAVKKNLDENTDMQMLWYMAQWIYHNSQQDGFPESRFTKARLTPNFEKHLHDSLSIAMARGIIRKATSEYAHETVYSFNTLFYYYAFCGSAPKDILHKNLIFAQEEDTLSVEPDNTDPYEYENLAKNVPKIIKNFTEEEQDALVGALAVGFRPELQAKLKNLMGSHHGHIFNGDVKILQVNQIAKSIGGMSDFVREIASGNAEYSDDQFGSYLSDMPRLRLRAANATVDEDDELSKFDTDEYVENVEEGVKESFKTNREFEGKTLVDWANEHTDQLDEMGVTQEHLDFTLSLQERDRDSILIALYLRCLFDEIVRLSEKAKSKMTWDYSPITIMLSKTLERILKEKHLPIYSDKKVWVNRVNTYSDDPHRKGTPITFGGIATIGTFTTALFAMFKIAPADPEIAKKEENRDKFVARTGTSARNWKQYMYNLNDAKGIRNNTAHFKPVNQESCDKFVELFFSSKLLRNTIEYVNNQAQ